MYIVGRGGALDIALIENIISTLIINYLCRKN